MLVTASAEILRLGGLPVIVAVADQPNLTNKQVCTPRPLACRGNYGLLSTCALVAERLSCAVFHGNRVFGRPGRGRRYQATKGSA